MKYLSLLIVFISFSFNAFTQASLVRDINPGANPSYITSIVELNGKAFVAASNGTVSGLFRSNGTSSGTVLITDSTASDLVGELTSSGAFLAWRGRALAGSGSWPWSSDGNNLTHLVSNISYPQSFAVHNGIVYFAGNTFDEGYEPWRTDGTPAGTYMLQNIPGAGFGNTISPADFVSHSDGFLYFLSHSLNATCSLWKSDGTTSGTFKVIDIPYASKLSSAGNKLYFLASPTLGPFDDYELWASDGTAAGTALVKNINPTGYSNIDRRIAFNNKLYFQATDGTNGVEFWVSDGTEAGTFMVADINPTGNGNFFPIGILADELFFSSNDGVNGILLFKFNPTSNLITMVKDFDNTSTSGGVLGAGVVFYGKLFFGASDNSNGYELWSTNGTTAGTNMVSNINETGDSFPMNLCVAGKRLFFSADNGVNGLELWKYEDPANPPCTDTLNLSGIANNDLYEANLQINSTATIPVKPNFTTYLSEAIILNPGFKTNNGAKFLAQIGGCN
ncbi:MAG: 3-coathanger stack domain-containing protein [Spirosomataceae bacterium]